MAAANSVEKLLDFYVSSDGSAYYQVKWAPTWEKAESLSQFQNLIDRFWEFVNKAHSVNVFNNHSNLPKPPPVLPEPPQVQQLQLTPSKPPVQRQTSQQKQTPKRKQTPQSKVGKKTVQRQPSNPTKSPSSMSMQPQLPNLQRFSNANTLQPTMNSLQQSPQNKQITQNKQMLQNKQTVVIDSDDEDDQLHPINPGLVQSTMQQIPPMQQVPSMHQMSPINQMPPMHQLSPMLNSGGGTQHDMQWPVKTEVVEQKHFPNPMFNQSPMFADPQQFQFGMQNTAPSKRGGGRGGRGGGPSPAKRKLGMPSSGVGSTPNAPFGAMKFENPDGKEMENNVRNLSASDWKEHFETLESFVDGKRASVSYKCMLCGSVMSQQGNCLRHFKKHTSDGCNEHECPICGKRFYRIDYIETHLKQHGQGSTEDVQKMIKLIKSALSKKT